jgi:CelD/BcsL family acetyltransferase involved in cellulose biosynthesis
MAYSVNIESFASLEDHWEELLHTSVTNTIFSTPQWQRVWWQEFGLGRELLLLSIRSGSQVVGIAPMMRQGDVLSLIGDSDTCDYLDFIVARGEEEAFSTALLDYLYPMEWSSLDLHHLLPSSVVASHFAPLAGARDYSVAAALEDICPGVELAPTWEEYLARLSGRDRHELRRKMRRLGQHAQARYYVVQDKERLFQDLQDFLRLFGQSRQDKAQFMTAQMASFFQAMAVPLAEKDYLRLFFLEVDGVRAASALCFDYGGELCLYNSGYDPAYASLSVGLLIKAFCIEEGILSGKQRFDFLRGAEPYKYRLGGQDVPVYGCLIRRQPAGSGDPGEAVPGSSYGANRCNQHT